MRKVDNYPILAEQVVDYFLLGQVSITKKRGRGDLKHEKIPLNPPLPKGEFLNKKRTEVKKELLGLE